jgi:hypothetical protein
MKVFLSVTSIFMILYSIFCDSKKTPKADFFKNAYYVGFNIDGLVKSPFCSLSDHLGVFQAVLLNFKNSSQAPQTA